MMNTRFIKWMQQTGHAILAQPVVIVNEQLNVLRVNTQNTFPWLNVEKFINNY